MGEASSFTETSVDQISTTVDRLRKSYILQKTRPVSYRIKALRKLYWAIEDHKSEIIEALKSDLGKGFYASMVEEISWVQNDCIFMANHIAKWAKDEKPADVGFPHTFMSPRLRKDPLGVVLVIGAFNFPIQLSLGPMIGAISGGNTVVLKPSEGAPASAMVMQKIIASALEPDCYTVVQGGVPQVQALLEQKWDKIFFTGSPRTGTIIAKKAAETLTPVALELGGRNPAFVTKKADLNLAARRLLWSKTMNAGQVCISHNYTMVDREVVDEYIKAVDAALKQFYPNGAKNNPDYGHINTKSGYNRIKTMLDNTNGKIVVGGSMDESQLFIEPTVVLVSSPDDSLLKDESFGPLMPILPVDNLDQAITLANQIHDTPLSLMAFGSKPEVEKILKGTRSGGASINDGFFHGVIPTIPFGGIGDSGHGAYRGKASFDCFTHARPVTTTPGWMEKMLAMRYPPFDGTGKWKEFARMGVTKPNFDREGNERLGWITWVFTLGGLLRGALFRRALFTGLLAIMVKTLIERRNSLGLSPKLVS